jgi:hypothetical protein
MSPACGRAQMLVIHRTFRAIGLDLSRQRRVGQEG